VSGGEDAELVRRCLSGDQRACRDLVRRYERPVYSVLMRVVRRAEDAEDLVQETFIKVFRALDRYDTERPFSAWVFTIASRLAIDHLRRRRVKTVSLEVSEPGSTEERTMDVEDKGLKPDEITSHAEEESRAARLIDSLPEPPVGPQRREYSGKFNVRVPKSLHASLASEAEAEGVSLNQLVVTKLALHLQAR